MQSIYLRNFRAFKDPIEIKLEDSEKHILLYGENGAGKTSIYDALELFFFYDELEKKAINGAIDATDEAQKRNDWLKSYLCKMATSSSITVKVNNKDFNTNIDKSAYQVLMLSNRSILYNDTISVKNLLDGIRLTGLDINTFLLNLDNRNLIEEYVNERLHNDFWESIKVKFDQGTDYCLEIADENRGGLKAIHKLPLYFNEAKIKLISLLVIFSTAELLLDLSDPAKKIIIVLDDIINSLDASNRLMLMKYIIKTFNGDNVEIISMTHNVSYYNLWLHYTKELKLQHRWKCVNIYVSEDRHKIIYYKDDTIKKIKQDYADGISNAEIGNRLRKHFERLLYELAKIIQVGPFNESKALIDSIVNKNNIYLNIPKTGRAQDGYEMMEEISRKYKRWKICTWKSELEKILNKYNETNNFGHLKSVIDEVVMYQKVALHQSSHGHMGINTIGDKEIRATIFLLEKMENAIDAHKDRNVYNV